MARADLEDVSSLRVLGITGPIGCGKTTTSQIAVELGAREHINADDVTHSLMSAETALSKSIEQTFGPEVISQSGSVDRRLLSELVFTDTDRLATLESLVHPAVRAWIGSRLEHLRAVGENGVVVVEAIKLLQSPLYGMTDEIWVVLCSSDQQFKRLAEIRGYTTNEIVSRIRAQPQFEGSNLRTIVNNGSLDDLRQNVEEEWLRFCRDHEVLVSG